MIRFVFALCLSVIVAVVLALGIAYLNETPDSSETVSETYFFTIK